VVGAPVNLFRRSTACGEASKNSLQGRERLDNSSNFIPAVNMRFLLRPAPVLVLASYLLLSLIPCVPILLGKQVPQLGHVLLLEALAWAAAWGLLQRPGWFHWLLIPAFLALPTELYLFIYYGQGISTHHLGIIAETSPKEALEFLGRKVWLMGAVMLAMVAWWIAIYIAARRSPGLAWRGRSRLAALLTLAVLAGFWAYGWEFGVAAKPVIRIAKAAAAGGAAGSALGSAISSALSHIGLSAPPAELDASEEQDAEEEVRPEHAAVAGAGRTGWRLPPMTWWARSPFSFDDLASSWPFGLSARGFDFYKERKYLAELGQRSSSFSFKARQPEANDRPRDRHHGDRRILALRPLAAERLRARHQSPAEPGSEPGGAAGCDHARLRHASVGTGHDFAQAADAEPEGRRLCRKILHHGLQGSRLQDLLAVEPDVLRRIRYAGVGVRQGSRRDPVHESGRLYQSLPISMRFCCNPCATPWLTGRRKN
jgi:hypothetical protein